MNSNEMKTIVKTYYDELWSKGELSVVDQFFSDDYENCDPATPGGVVRGKDAFRSFIRTYRDAFPDLRMQIIEQWADGDTVISRWHASGTQRGALMGIPATNKSGAGVEGVTLTLFRNGKIVRDRAVWDLMGLMRQLGVIPS